MSIVNVFLYIFVSVCTCMPYMWQSGDFWELVLSFYRVGHRDQAQVLRHDSLLYLWTHLTQE